MLTNRQITTLILLTVTYVNAFSQITGKVIDSKTREPIDYVNVYYEGKNCGELTDENGRFVIKEDSTWNELTIRTLGYVTQVVKLDKGHKRNKNLVIRLVPEPRILSGVSVSAKKTKYSRKNNPAVELMKKVISHKKNSDLRSRDFFNYNKYEKMVFSINEVTDNIFEQEDYKKFSFLKDHVERCPQTDKLILPLTVEEKISQVFYRKSSNSTKTVIKAESNKGVNELINTGEILTTMLNEVFTDVNIYENECRLLQYQFKSPIADNAISFYRYYIQDTLMVEGEKVIDVGFLPNNQQDFGFSGHLHIMADSTYQVRRLELNIPKRSDVNFVDNMIITQELTELPTGERIATVNDMLVELKLTKWLGKFMCQRTTRIKDVSFDEIPNSIFKRIKGDTYKEPDAEMQSDDYWREYRDVELSESESKMDGFMNKLTNIKGFKYIIFGAKALIENFVETSDSLQNNKVDIGPINTIISNNHYDKWRFRASALTTAHLSPHFFANGYVAYGTKTKNVYGKLQLTYSFNKKAYLTREFPQNNLSVYYWNDVRSPFDKFIPTDKDNMFLALQTSKVDQYTHTKEVRVDYTREYENGLKLNAQFTTNHNRAVDALFFQPLNGSPTPDGTTNLTEAYRTSEFKAGISFEPGATYINTKQRRIKVNKDAPILSVSHTVGIKGLLGSEYNYNVTEAGLYKRFWLGSWGKWDNDVKAGIQWNKVPFPLLIHPAANQAYILEDYCFNLISSNEFLNDRYVTYLTSWDMNGKILNRIPLIKKLKWREMIGFNVLWGQLTDHNNPATSGYRDSKLFYFPGHFLADGTYEQNTVNMDTKTPYVEMRIGIHNIFKLIEVDYVRRLTYLDNPNTNKWGIRFMFRMSF
jgi:hypothetical protein